MRGRVWQAFYEAGPYISNLNWLKEIIKRNIIDVLDLEEFEKKLRIEERSTEEIVKRNDIKIYLMYLVKKSN